MILTTTDPSCISRDPRALGREWSELARRRARPVVFLTPQWLGVARAHDPPEQLTFAVGDPAVGVIALARDELAPDFETFVQGLTKKERHELRRKIRRLESGREVTFRFATDAERSAVLDRFVALHRLSRGEKATFMTAERERFFRDMADALAIPGWLRLGVLRVDGEDAAVLYAFAYAGTLALYNAAYDPALAPLSVGIVCHAYAIREAIAERLATYDLLRGNEPYKYDLGAEDHWLVRLEATRPRRE